MKQIYLVILCLALASCSSALKIRVDVLNREALRKFPAFRKIEAEQLYAQLKIAWTDSAINAQRFFLKIETRKSLQDPTIAPADTAILYKSISKQVDTILDSALRALKGYERLNESSESIKYHQSKISMEAAVDKFLGLKKSIELELGKSVPSFATFFQKRKSELLLTEDELLNDVLTSAVVHSPYKFWRQVKVEKDFSGIKYKRNQYKQKSAYSRTVVRTLLGNSDIAITMENKGHFTVKGVRLDAAKVAEATFKGLTQSIHFLAMTTGAPVKKDNAESNLLPELEKLTSLKATSEATEKSFKESALILTAVAVRNQADLVGANNEKKKAAIEIVKKEFEAFKNQFNTTKNPEP